MDFSSSKKGGRVGSKTKTKHQQNNSGTATTNLAGLSRKIGTIEPHYQNDDHFESEPVVVE